MNLGKVIRERRKALNITQAQIAERLGVSTPAVNKWEKNQCCPDIAVLAPLARLLRIDLNELFDFYSALTEEEIRVVCDYVVDGIREGATSKEQRYEEVIRRASIAVQENPSDAALHQNLALAVSSFAALDQTEQADGLIEKAVALYERALELDADLTEEISSALIDLYNRLNKYESAANACDRLPDLRFDKEWRHAEMLRGQGKYGEAAKEMKAAVLASAIKLENQLSMLTTTLKLAGEQNQSDVTGQWRQQVIQMFGLWEGLDRYHEYIDGYGRNDPEMKLNAVLSILGLSGKSTAISSSPLFEGCVETLENYPDESVHELLEEIKILNTHEKIEFDRSEIETALDELKNLGEI